VAQSVERLLCTLAYHGAHYAGWQSQKNQVGIQSILQSVLTEMHTKDVRVVGSGRTDAGVHALAQRFHFDTPLNLSCEAWQKAFNAKLPLSIRVTAVERVAPEFHARFSVKAKRYRYRVSTQPLTPFNYQLMHYEYRDIDVHQLKEAMKLFVGTHDFTSFNATPIREIQNQVRTIYSFELKQTSEGFDFIIEGSGFLRYMIRMLVAACLDVGGHKLSLAELEALFEARSKQAYSGIVSSSGLYLEEVRY